ncbi:unnamed protein product [Strongylus vulgaris]|uniref:Uncharacterized protein n=1 Tax=Strongylus vulgaris TaxID=40348 RepID=A0A3P7IGP9_STRVU|nr:unnamed protein product [Strongylus vulgaris]
MNPMALVLLTILMITKPASTMSTKKMNMIHDTADEVIVREDPVWHRKVVFIPTPRHKYRLHMMAGKLRNPENMEYVDDEDLFWETREQAEAAQRLTKITGAK